MSGEFRAFLKTSREQGEAVRGMMKSDGWILMEQWISSQITARTLQLLDCSLVEVSEKRAEIRTLKAVLARVKDFLQCGQAAERELQRNAP